MNLERYEPPSKELQVVRFDGSGYEIAIVYNQRMARMETEDLKKILKSIGFRRVIQNLLYLNQQIFHITPIVKPDRNYIFEILMPIEFKVNFNREIYVNEKKFANVLTDDQYSCEYQGCFIRFGCVERLTFYGDVIAKELKKTKAVDVL